MVYIGVPLFRESTIGILLRENQGQVWAISELKGLKLQEFRILGAQGFCCRTRLHLLQGFEFLVWAFVVSQGAFGALTFFDIKESEQESAICIRKSSNVGAQ